MFTLTRLAAAILMTLFLLWVAPIYDQIHDPRAPMRGIAYLLGTMGFIAGWVFLGQKSQALWWSVCLGLQAVVLAGLGAALLVAVRDSFVLGYRRQVREPIEAVTAIPQIAWDYLSKALAPELWPILVGGGVGLGLAVHVIDRLLDRRRLDR
jgi:hypothetical protein